MADLGRLDEAVALQQRAIALDPLRTQSHFNLALSLIALGRYDEAEAPMRKAIALQPQSAQNYYRLSEIQILRVTPAPRWNLRNRKPIRPGAPTRWRWLSSPMATGPRPTLR